MDLRRHLLTTLLCMAVGESAYAQSTPLHTTLGAERVRLPGGEHMGLVGGSVLFGVGSEWWLGPAVYGAATGSRGGLFVGGVQVLRRWPIGDRWWLNASAYAGGGGGASAPVGGGLMLRPEVAILRDLGPYSVGMSLSHVRFPSGDIRSSQLGLLWAWDGEFRSFDASRSTAAAAGGGKRSGLGFDLLAGTATQYRFRDTARRQIGLVGARAERADGSWRWGLEAAAAAQGDAAGYMEILATLGHDWSLGTNARTAPRIGLRTAVGLGGGGAVPTNGGGLAKLALGIAWPLGGGLTIGAEAGLLRAFDSPLHGRTAQVWLAMDLEPARGAASSSPTRTEWAATLQHIARAERVDGTRSDLQTIGLKLNRYVGPSLYLSAQAHSAFAGGAGAYSVGLVGAGLATAPATGAWQIGAEALIGAAGGGGVVTGGGAIVQALAWAGWRTGPDAQWRLGLGGVRSSGGNLSSPVAELTWSRAFAL